MKALYALCDDGRSAQRAVDGLRQAGITDQDITVISAQPMDDFAFSRMHSRTYMWYMACVGAALGFTAATTLTYVTQSSWALRTGGMPIVSWWTNLIIIFEMTMLSAIVATVITLLVTAGLPSRGGKLYDPEVSDGYILVGVENPSDAGRLESALALDGGRVKRT